VSDTKEKEYFKEIMGNRKFRTLLRYKGSRDGWMADDFHRMSDGKGPTVALIMTTNNVLCGGFLKIPIKSEGSRSKDADCFLFSLKTLTKYQVVDSSEATYL
jgi:hypothetical protein